MFKLFTAFLMVGAVVFWAMASPALAQQKLMTQGEHLSRELATYQRQMDGHINRLDDRLNRMTEQNKTLVRTNRDLERAVDDLQTENAILKKQAAFFNDALVKIENTTLTKFEGAIGRLENSENVFNWGSGERDCQDGGKHQAIRNVMSPGSQYTLKYLCFDGKLVHMGTEYNLPPQ